MVRLDRMAQQQLSGQSVIATLYSNVHSKGEPFERTLLTHPAIFMVEYSLAQSVIHAGVWPDMVLGVSLGAFAAAAVAGFIDVDDALAAVVQQALAFEEACEPGGMIAIFADPGLFAEGFLGGRSELVSVNSFCHFVVSARQRELGEIEAAMRQRNIGYQRLPVSFPFHSQWIEKAKFPFNLFMQSIQCKQGGVPLACCDQMKVLFDLGDGYFWDVVRHPIRFRETVERLEQQSVHRYVDVGPASTLATVLKHGMHTTTKSTMHAVLTPYGHDQKNLSDLLASVRN